MPDIQQVYSINNAIHIDEETDKRSVVITNNLERAKAIYNDTAITSQLKVDGGLWTDAIQTTSIIPHEDSLEFSNNVLSIGKTSGVVNIDGSILNLTDNLIINKSDQTYTLDIATHTIKASKNIKVNTNIDGGYIEIDNEGSTIQVGTAATSQLNLYASTFITDASTTSLYADDLTLDVNNAINIETKLLNIPNYIYANDETKLLKFGDEALIFSNNSNITLNAKTLNINSTSYAKISTSTDTGSEMIEVDATQSNITLISRKDIQLKGASDQTSMTIDDTTSQILFKADSITYDVASLTNQIASLTTQSDTQVNNATTSITNTTQNLDNNATTSITNTTSSITNSASASITNSTDVLSNITQTVFNKSDIEIKTITPIINNSASSIINQTTTFNNTATTSITNNTPAITNITSNLTTTGSNINITASVNEIHTTPVFQLNTTTDPTHLVVSKSENTITAKTSLVEINSSNEKAHLSLNKGSGTVVIGSPATSTSTLSSKNIIVNAPTFEKHTTKKFEINDNNNGGYLLVDKDQAKVIVGSSTTGITDINGSIMNVSALQQEVHITPSFSINPTQKTRFQLNNDTGNINVRAEKTMDMSGNVVVRGSTNKSGSGALMVDNISSNIGFIVKQKDATSDIIQLWGNGTSSTNTDINNTNSTNSINNIDLEKILYIDNEGRTTFGNDTTEPSYFSINRSPNISSAEDLIHIADNDTSRLVITTDGKVGINTNDPKVIFHIEDNSAIKLPRGGTDERPLADSDIQKGYIRYNTTTDQFEGFGAGNTWGSLGGVIDVDQDTYIKAETNAGEDNDELQFYTAGTERMTISSDGKVGINTATPGYNLDIGGDLNFSGKLTCNAVDILEMFQRSLDFVYADKPASKLDLGDDTLNNMNINARDIVIGRDGGTTKILGDFVAYGMGSNVTITNVTKESSSFVVENFGTDVGFQVKQVNVMECNIDAFQVYVGDDENNMDMTMRIDGVGNVGIGGGIHTGIGDSNLEAWLQIKGDAKNSSLSVNPARDLFRVDHYDDLDDKPSMIIKDDGKIGVGVSDPREMLDINGKMLSVEMTGGVVAKAMDIPTDAMIKWTLVDANLDEVINYGTSNMYFNGQVLNNNKRVVDLSATQALEQQKNVMVWYKFDEIVDGEFQNHAEYNDMTHSDPNATDSTILFEDIPVIKRVRGVGGAYLLYFDSEVLLGNGEAYLYPKETDVPFLLDKMNGGFTYSVTVKTDDNSLPSISLFSVKTAENVIINLKVIEEGHVRFTVGDVNGASYMLTSAEGVEEQVETNIIFNLTVEDGDSSTSSTSKTTLRIYIGGFLDSTLEIPNFIPNFSVPDVIVRMGSEITPDISPIFIRDIQMFERSLEQTEIWGLNGLDIEGNRDRNVKVSATRDYLMEVDGNLKINDSLVINNGQVNKVLFSTGGQQYMSTNRESLCQLGIMLEWDNDLSHYPDVESYLFRSSIRFHVSGSNENNNFGFRVFDAFISPKNDPNAGLPGSIISTNLSDTVASTFIIRQSDIIRKGATKSLILIEWRNLDENNNSCRGYIDTEILVSSELGVMRASTYVNIIGEGFVF